MIDLPGDLVRAIADSHPSVVACAIAADWLDVSGDPATAILWRLAAGVEIDLPTAIAAVGVEPD